MKAKVFFMISLMLTSFLIFGQDGEQKSKMVIEPQFRYYHSKSINDYVQKNLKLPSTKINSIDQGTLVMQFVVGTNGKITDFEIVNSVCNEFDADVERLIMLTSGLWNPGYLENEAVPMKTEVSVLFYNESIDDIVNLTQEHLKKGTYWLSVKNNPKKALNHFNMGISLLPYESSSWLNRSLCKQKLGDNQGAQDDLARFYQLAALHVDE